MAVQELYMIRLQRTQNVRRKGDTSGISGAFSKIQAGVAQDGIGKPAVVRTGIIRSDDNAAFFIGRKVFGVVHDSVGNAVNYRGKGIVQ